MTPPIQLSVRRPAGNDNHHLWNNHGTWWCALTIHRPDFTKARLRRSLGTDSVDAARDIRDFLLAVLPDATDLATAA